MVNTLETKIEEQFKFINFSIVLVGAGFSPELYTPDYLIDKEIVNSQWGWKVSGNINNNNVSAIVFDSGKRVIKIEKSKVTISENIFVEDEAKEKGIIELAISFLERHKHLAFTAVGINYIVLRKMDATDNFLLHKFIVQNYWQTNELNIETVGLRLVYPINTGGTLTLNLDEGGEESKIPEVGGIDGIICQANFHRDYAPDSNITEIISQVRDVKKDWIMLNNILKSIFV